jgi:hypothetical protein
VQNNVFDCKAMQIFSGEGGEGTLSFSAFIFKKFDSGDGIRAPNFPPHHLVTIDVKSY